MVDALDYFAALVQQDASFPLFEAALSLELDEDPHLDLVAATAELDMLGAKLQKRVTEDTSSIARLRILNHYFYRELAFGGNVNNYYDPDNSYLHRVIANRRGIPISLAVIYIELASQIGLEVKGISFPGHFLMKLPVQTGEIIIDPFNGTSLSREELEERLEPYLVEHTDEPDMPLASYLQPAPPRDIIARMLRNLKSLFHDQGRWHNLLPVQRRLVILLPDDITEMRDRGLTYARLDRAHEALPDLEAYLLERPYAPDAKALRSQIGKLRKSSKPVN